MGISYSTKINERRAQRLVDRLKKIDKKLDRIIAEVAVTTETSNYYWTRTNRRIREVYNEARYISNDWTLKAIPKTYQEQLKHDIMKMKSKKIKPPAMLDIKDLSGANVTVQSIQALMAETAASMNTGFLSGQKTMTILTRTTQQVNISEKAIEKSIEQGFIETGTVTGAKKDLQNKLMKQALDGKYITVIDKNGKPIQYQISSYADLVARTKLQETSAQATVNTTQAVGEDLVQVSSHNTETPFDAQFEGKIFSLSGNDKDFPKATFLPPFHPNCKHSITTVIKDALEINGSLDDYIEFSNDRIEKHPTNTTFIPVSKRKKV